MKVKIKKLHPDAVIPKYAKEGDAGMDLVAISKAKILLKELDWRVQSKDNFDHIEYGTGLAIEIPKGYVGLIFPRSSIYKTNLELSNSVGVIDSGYRGEIKFKFYEALGYNDAEEYQIGDRIGQIMIIPYPEIEFEQVKELETSERGSGGYGSTGK